MKASKNISRVFNIISVPLLIVLCVCFIGTFVASLFTLLPQFAEAIYADLESGRATSDFSPEETVVIVRAVLISSGSMMLLFAAVAIVALIFDLKQLKNPTLGGAITNLVFANVITNPFNIIASVFQIILFMKEKRKEKNNKVVFESKE